MASVNKAILICTLGKDVELRRTASGQAVASFPAATSEKFKDKEGNYIERTEWHNIVLWGKVGEIAAEFLSKGKSVYIEGRLQTRKWQDKAGIDRYTTEIVGDKIQMLSPKTEGGSSGGKRNDSEKQQSGQANYEEPPFQDDDIPY